MSRASDRRLRNTLKNVSRLPDNRDAAWITSLKADPRQEFRHGGEIVLVPLFRRRRRRSR